MTKPRNVCDRPLEASDFNRYDIVADNRLFKKEMSDEQYRCFLQQLIRTNDREVLKQFTDAIQNDLWERISKDLKRISKKKKLPPAIKDIVRTMMRHEFSNRILRGEVKLTYSYDYRNVNNTMANSSSRELYHVHLLSLIGLMKINAPFKGWRWKSQLAVNGKQFWYSSLQTTDTNGGSDRSRVNQNYQEIATGAYTTVLKRDSSVKFYLDGNFSNSWNPLPDGQLRSYGVSGSFTLHHPFKVPFSLRAQAAWSTTQHEKPLDPAYNTISTDSVSANAEASYMFKKRAGIVGVYDFLDKEQVKSFYTRGEFKHKPSLLAHVKFKKGYIRIGGGGGVWDESFRLLGEDTDTVAGGAEAHGSMNLYLKPKKKFSIKLDVEGMGNFNEGEYKGWFPSWSSTLSLMVMLKKLYIRLNQGYHGHHRDLGQKQTLHGTWTQLKMYYRPTNNWNLSLMGYHYYAQQTGHQPYIEHTWTASTAAGVRLVKKPDFWLQLNLQAIGYKFEQEDYKRDQISISSMLYAQLRF